MFLLLLIDLDFGPSPGLVRSSAGIVALAAAVDAGNAVAENPVVHRTAA